MTGIGHNGVAAEQLQSFIYRIERLDEERLKIVEDIKEVKSEAKGMGFDVKTINRMLKLRKLSEEERQEQEALDDIYKAALGMLSDTPLGAAALDRLSKKPKPKPAEGGQPVEDLNAAAEMQAPLEEPTKPTDDDIQAAKDAGRAAAAGNQPVTVNPYAAGDPRRAAFDEAWCQAAGSDGMDIPEAFRRTPKPKKPKGSGEGGEE